MGKIKKVGLITNTYLKEVPGMFYTSEGLQPLPVAVRFTSDRTGETLSLAVREDDWEKGVQIIIEFSNIEDLIKTTLRVKGTPEEWEKKDEARD